MKFNKIIPAVFLGAAVFYSAVVFAEAKRLPETIIRIGLLQGIKSFNLSCEGKYYVYEINSGDTFSIKPMDDYLIKGMEGYVIIDGYKYSSPVRIISRDGARRIRVDGRRYRDNILIYSKNSMLTVINELGLEDYIKGIIPREVNPGWHMEALKAQSVVSRTYCLRNLGKHGRDKFDLCNTVHCQVYGGVESEKESTSEAVELTRGRVVAIGGQLAAALFHADCGGFTEDPGNVWFWDSSVPGYLKGRVCRYCKGSPHNRWKVTLAKDEIRKKLNSAGTSVGEISSIKIISKNKTGRAENLLISHEGGSVKMMAAKFRMAVSPFVIKSTMFDGIRDNGDSIEFSGRGWGHGVGMCQWGAKGMAEKGYNYKKILSYYFPGTEVEIWEE